MDAEFITNMAKKRKSVYIYFNNDAQGNAVKNAFTLIEMVSNENLAKYSPGQIPVKSSRPQTA
jgi:uncharacterized protein YecE (DUF72 family)